ncbi:hypothetical protein [Mangrovibacterium marinum]|uniref:PEGA domain-containing protein n=1 Tax=Mangrovibacterium marinum TaxID=1639118 RepID=A0A2T5C202_9BACT|nr:hypothetical protein [Mangrovibacterium marinum]PTN08695.1 hypothetical protein C8N47_10750 [Mangrovibacterium marinum]
MKKLIFFFFAIISFTACGPHLYNTMSAGKDNASFIVVVTNGQSYADVSVIVDGESFPVEKVYKLKRIRKAHPISITPGKHDIKVVSGVNTLIEENIFIGLQETKKIVLQ